jgi:16S rRNA (adenine1518-N6/adenine1519-N6)-dimethyltransferase
MNQKLFNEDYLRHLCQLYDIIPSKKYGQNFLIDPEPVEEIIEAAEIKAGETVVEVGPGFGVLTFALSEKVKKVLAFEIEKRLLPYWDEQMEKNKNIEIVWGNVLHEIENQNLVKSLPAYKVVANLPYQITSHAIRTFLEMEHAPESMVLMVQKEVAERICAKAGDMSVLAVSVQFYGKPEIVTVVPRSCFWPIPAVDSAVIRIKISAPKDKTVAQSRVGTEQFFGIVRAGFSSKRKMLIKNLGSVIDKNKLRNIFREVGINEKIRAQELSMDQWRELVSKAVS